MRSQLGIPKATERSRKMPKCDRKGEREKGDREDREERNARIGKWSRYFLGWPGALRVRTRSRIKPSEERYKCNGNTVHPSALKDGICGPFFVSMTQSLCRFVGPRCDLDKADWLVLSWWIAKTARGHLDRERGKSWIRITGYNSIAGFGELPEHPNGRKESGETIKGSK